MIHIKVHFFSTIRARVGVKDLELELPENSRVEDLKAEIASRFPQAAPTIEGMMTSVNEVFSDDTTIIPDGAQVAFFPYVTGGADFYFPGT
jgi:molybdopterin converting factor small subunit